MQLGILAQNLEEFQNNQQFEFWKEDRVDDGYRQEVSDVVDVETLLVFAKSCLSEILQHQTPVGHCIDPQNFQFIATKLRQLLSVSDMENFELMIDNDRLCYSYEIPKPETDKKYLTSGCLTVNELVSKLSAMLFAFPPQMHRKPKRPMDLPTNHMYCFDADTARTAALLTVFCGAISWVIFIQFQNSSTATEFFKKVT